MSSQSFRPQSPALLLSFVITFLIPLSGCGIWSGQQLADHLDGDVEVDVLPGEDGQATEVAAVNGSGDEASTGQRSVADTVAADEGQVTQRALGRLPDPLIVDMPPIPMRRVVSASSSTNLLQPPDAPTELPTPLLTDPATRSPAATATAKPGSPEPVHGPSEAVSVVASAWPVSPSRPSSPRREPAADETGSRATQTVHKVEKIGTGDFQDIVLSSDGLVIVDFYAPWCGPCKQLAPLLDEVARERRSVRIVKVDIDDDKPLARRYGIRSIPTVLVFEDGKAVGRYTGLPQIRKGLDL